MSHEDGNGHEEHTTDGNNTEKVTIVKGGLVVFSAEGQVVIAQQRDANDGQQLRRSTR